MTPAGGTAQDTSTTVAGLLALGRRLDDLCAEAEGLGRALVDSAAALSWRSRAAEGFGGAAAGAADGAFRLAVHARLAADRVRGEASRAAAGGVL